MDAKDPMSWLSLEFWKTVTQDTMKWAIHSIPKVLVILVLAFVLLKLLNFIAKKVAEHAKDDANGDGVVSVGEFERKKRAETLIGIVRKSGQIAIWSLVALLLLMQVGVDVAPLIAGAGIVGLAVGFGAQELVRDLITGFFMLLENQVRQGDVAIVNGTGGLVEVIGLRTIRLRDMSGVVHVFQNGKISSLANMTKDWSAMVFDIRVAYKEDIDRVMDVVKTVAGELKNDPEFSQKILEDLELFGVDSLGESSVVIKARFKTRPIEQWNVGREFNRRLKIAFDKAAIEIPFPHRTLTWSDNSKPFQVLHTGEEFASESPPNQGSVAQARSAKSD